jgi:hypothetical protein
MADLALVARNDDGDHQLEPLPSTEKVVDVTGTSLGTGFLYSMTSLFLHSMVFNPLARLSRPDFFFFCIMPSSLDSFAFLVKKGPQFHLH